MKTAGFKYLFVIALAALTVQACAKKDSSLRARQTQTAEDKATAEKLAAEKAKAEAEAKATGKEIPKEQEPGASKQVVCVSKTVLELYGDENEIKLEDIATKQKGTLTLTDTVSNISIQNKDGKAIGDIELTAEKFETPENLKEVTANKALFSCNNLVLTEKENYPVSALSLPNSINTEDGTVTAMRSENMTLKAGSFTNISVLKAVSINVKDAFANLSKATDVKTLIVRNNDQGISLRVQYKMTDSAGLKMTKTMRANYVFKSNEDKEKEVIVKTSEKTTVKSAASK